MSNNILNFEPKKSNKTNRLISRDKWDHFQILSQTMHHMLRKLDYLMVDDNTPKDWTPTFSFKCYLTDPNWFVKRLNNERVWIRTAKDKYLKTVLNIIESYYKEAAESINESHKYFIIREIIDSNKEIYTLVNLRNNTYWRFLIPNFKKFTSEFKLGLDYTLEEYYNNISKYTLTTTNTVEEGHAKYYNKMLDYFTDITHHQIKNKIIRYILKKKNIKPIGQQLITLAQ